MRGPGEGDGVAIISIHMICILDVLLLLSLQ